MTMVNRFFMKQVMERIAKLEKQVAQLQEDAKRVEPVGAVQSEPEPVKRGPGRPRKVES